MELLITLPHFNRQFVILLIFLLDVSTRLIFTSSKLAAIHHIAINALQPYFLVVIREAHFAQAVYTYIYILRFITIILVIIIVFGWSCWPVILFWELQLYTKFLRLRLEDLGIDNHVDVGPVVRIFVQHRLNQRRELRANMFRNFNLIIYNLLFQFIQVARRKRVIITAELVQDHSQGPHVGCGGVLRLPRPQFGCQVIRCADHWDVEEGTLPVFSLNLFT